MWFWAISAISGSILGSATSKWFEKTQLGRWTYEKIYNLYNWAADRYGLQIIKAEDKWKKKYPNVGSILTNDFNFLQYLLMSWSRIPSNI